MNRRNIERWAPVATAAAALVLWQAVCSVFAIADFIFPSPLTIAAAMGQYAGPIAEAAWKTFWVTMLGFAISIVVGVLLGFLVGSSRMAYAAIYPLLVGFNAVPKAAIVPILIVWFGIGIGPGILTAFLISFFPITVNIATGLATLEPELEDVLRVLGAKRWDVQHVFEFGFERGQTGRDVHRDREERDQERGQDAGPETDAEPHDQDRHDRRFRHRVEADQQRVQRRVGEPRRADQETEQHADDDRDREAQHRDPEGLPRGFGDRPGVLDRRLRDRQRAREDEVGDPEQRTHRLPQQQQRDARGDRRPAFDAALIHALAPPTFGKRLAPMCPRNS